MKLSTRWVIVGLTSLVWLLVSSWFDYQWVEGCMADVNCREYEGIWILPAMGFAIYEGPRLVLILALILLVERIVFFGLERRNRAPQAL